MKCKCGNDRFIAHQICHHDVIVDGDGQYTEEVLVDYGGKPFGPFTCFSCGTMYKVLEEFGCDAKSSSK